MQLGIIGLGRMGGNMVERLIKGGHGVVAYDTNLESVMQASSGGAVPAASMEDLVGKLSIPRAVWVMVPAGLPTESTLESLLSMLSPGDVMVDGGNSNYEDSVRRATQFEAGGIHFLDVGTSGGIWGLKEGYALMIGGNRDAFRRLEPLFKTLAPAPDRGYAHVGPSGSGHFVKMVHNGIEYGLMQAYAEGFELLEAKKEFELDLPQIAELWKHGSVVRSWLLDLAASALADDPKLESLQAYVEDSGEGRWTVQESVKLGVPMPVITLALQARFRSRQDGPFGARLLAALRNKFGGHEVRREEG